MRYETQRRFRRGRSVLLAVCAILVLPFALTAPAGATSLMVQDGVFGSSAWQDAGLKEQAYTTAAYMGGRHVRTTVTREQGFSWAQTDAFVADVRAHAAEPYVTLTYRPTNWGDPAKAMAIPSNAEFAFWCREAATRYRGQVSHYSVWNEPNHLRVGPTNNSQTLTAAQYGSLYRACYNEIKQADPAAKVYLGELATKPGSCDYLTGLTNATTTTDGVAIHPYQFRDAPSVALPEDCRGIGNLSDWNSRIATRHGSGALRTPGGGRPPLVIGEFGYCTADGECACDETPNCAGNQQSEATRAQWIGAAYSQAVAAGVTLFSYYHLVKAADPWSIKWDSGIVNRDGGSTQSVESLRAATGSAQKVFFLRDYHSTGTHDRAVAFGTAGDIPVAGDWNGDGVDTPGVFRPSNGTWYLRNSNTTGPTDIVFTFGVGGMLPVVGDWNNDGKDSAGLFHGPSGNWYLRNSHTTGAHDYSFTFGVNGMTPVAGDWNSDGTDTVGLFSSPSNWFLRNSHSGGAHDISFSYGAAGMQPVVGDWDSNGSDPAGMFASPSNWFLRNSHSNGVADVSFSFGASGMAPVAGDWNGDGVDTAGMVK